MSVESEGEFKSDEEEQAAQEFEETGIEREKEAEIQELKTTIKEAFDQRQAGKVYKEMEQLAELLDLPSDEEADYSLDEEMLSQEIPETQVITEFREQTEQMLSSLDSEDKEGQFIQGLTDKIEREILQPLESADSTKRQEIAEHIIDEWTTGFGPMSMGTFKTEIIKREAYGEDTSEWRDAYFRKQQLFRTILKKSFGLESYTPKKGDTVENKHNYRIVRNIPSTNPTLDNKINSVIAGGLKHDEKITIKPSVTRTYKP